MDDHAGLPLDAETKVAERPADHEAELRLWLRLLTCTTLIEGAGVNRSLQGLGSEHCGCHERKERQAQRAAEK